MTTRLHKHYLSLFILLILFGAITYGQEENYYTVKKGGFYSSLNFSLDQKSAKNENQIIRQVIDQYKYDYTIIANAGYAIKDNLTLGFSVGFGRGNEEITYLEQDKVWGGADDTPTHLTAVFSPSALGDFFTRAIDSELIINNFEPKY